MIWILLEEVSLIQAEKVWPFLESWLNLNAMSSGNLPICLSRWSRTEIVRLLKCILIISPQLKLAITSDGPKLTKLTNLVTPG